MQPRSSRGASGCSDAPSQDCPRQVPWLCPLASQGPSNGSNGHEGRIGFAIKPPALQRPGDGADNVLGGRCKCHAARPAKPSVPTFVRWQECQISKIVRSHESHVTPCAPACWRRNDVGVSQCGPQATRSRKRRWAPIFKIVGLRSELCGTGDFLVQHLSGCPSAECLCHCLHPSLRVYTPWRLR